MSPASRTPFLCGGAQAALDKRRDQRTAVSSPGMHILRWVDRSRRNGSRVADQGIVDRVAVKQRLHRRQPLRPIASADDTDMRIAHLAVGILVVKEGDAGEREIALPLGEFLKGPAAFPKPE